MAIKTYKSLLSCHLLMLGESGRLHECSLPVALACSTEGESKLGLE